MKKIILFSLILLYSLIVQATNITVNTPGNLSNILSSHDKSTITNLVITGILDARDIKCIRDEIIKLTFLDLSEIFITSYSGNGGTSNSTMYLENEIPENSFYNGNSGNQRLISINLPNSITSIANRAFYQCIALTSLTIPSSVSSIGALAFFDCININQFIVPETNLNFKVEEGVLFNKNQTVLIQCPIKKSGQYTIPTSVITVENSAFYNCDLLTNIIIPNSVSTIGNASFAYCKGIKNISLPNSILTIDNQAFSNCTSLDSISIGNSINTIGNESFSFCSVLNSIFLPNSISKIGERAFFSCDKLERITIPSSVSSIGFLASSSCKGLKEFIVDEQNQSYSSYNGVLYNKDKSILIQCPAQKEGIYNIPSTVKIIDSYAFNNCKNISGIEIKSNQSH